MTAMAPPLMKALLAAAVSLSSPRYQGAKRRATPSGALSAFRSVSSVLDGSHRLLLSERPLAADGPEARRQTICRLPGTEASGPNAPKH